jgi:chromatin structure-remodeling complex subunit RSC9
MVLALRCGIQEEISWALDRLLRLCSNEKFFLKTIPGLTDALFEWPEWFVEHGAGLGGEDVDGDRTLPELNTLFALPADMELKRRHALEAVCIFRTATANNDTNVQELSDNPRTRKLILFALHRVRPDTDANTEFLVNILEIFHDIAGTLSLPPPDAHLLANPVPPVLEIISSSTNRSLITASLSLLTTLFSNPTNVGHLSASSPALTATIKYLPLFVDKGLVDACLNYLYAHLAHPPMAKAFLVHSQMQSTLKLLVILLLSEQVEETVNVDLCPPPITAPVPHSDTVDYELSKEELDALAALPEPQRCYEWCASRLIYELCED